ncbi:hypothetical protein NtRootA1_31260 [Arthrobacter sp. NtRootA1]|nr:hypothetical protein NtRootA1_31260 [Arthrobacter sp. NtRootA1]
MSRTGDDTVAGESANTSVPAAKSNPLMKNSRQNSNCAGPFGGTPRAFPAALVSSAVRMRTSLARPATFVHEGSHPRAAETRARGAPEMGVRPNGTSLTARGDWIYP